MEVGKKRDPILDPTPHEAYLYNLTPKVAYKLLDAIKAQAMKDYINALSTVKYNPRDVDALRTISECEQLFSYSSKLATVRRNVKYDGGMFEIICMENFPTKWGETLPTKEHALKCPVCKDGRIGRSYQPKQKGQKLSGNRYPRIICSCDVCTYKFVWYTDEKGMDEDNMRSMKETMKIMSIQERERLCREEINDILKEHPEYTQPEKDAVYRRLTRKWRV